MGEIVKFHRDAEAECGALLAAAKDPATRKRLSAIQYEESKVANRLTILSPKPADHHLKSMLETDAAIENFRDREDRRGWRTDDVVNFFRWIVTECEALAIGQRSPRERKHIQDLRMAAARAAGEFDLPRPTEVTDNDLVMAMKMNDVLGMLKKGQVAP